LFLRRRHLAERMHSILTEVSMSRFRLLSSYATMAAVLAAAGWIVFASFPLVGQAQVQTVTVPADQPGVAVTPGGNLVRRPSMTYPAEALQKRIEGPLFVELTVNANGEVTDAHVISGPDELRKSVLQSVLQWRYAPENTPTRTAVVTVDFRLPPAGQSNPS